MHCAILLHCVCASWTSSVCASWKSWLCLTYSVISCVMPKGAHQARTCTHPPTHPHTPPHTHRHTHTHNFYNVMCLHAGPFTPVFRANLLAEWTAHLQKAAVPHSDGSSLIKTLQDPVKVCACVYVCVHVDVCIAFVLVARNQRIPQFESSCT